MKSRPLSEDTLLDKAVRFVIGAFLGAITALGLFFYMALPDRWLLVLVVAALLCGVLAVIVGNRFIEAWVKDEDEGIWRWLKW
jgi:hypothetical protein